MIWKFILLLLNLTMIMALVWYIKKSWTLQDSKVQIGKIKIFHSSQWCRNKLNKRDHKNNKTCCRIWTLGQLKKLQTMTINWFNLIKCHQMNNKGNYEKPKKTTTEQTWRYPWIHKNKWNLSSLHCFYPSQFEKQHSASKASFETKLRKPRLNLQRNRIKRRFTSHSIQNRKQEFIQDRKHLQFYQHPTCQGPR